MFTIGGGSYKRNQNLVPLCDELKPCSLSSKTPVYRRSVCQNHRGFKAVGCQKFACSFHYSMGSTVLHDRWKNFNVLNFINSRSVIFFLIFYLQVFIASMKDYFSVLDDNYVRKEGDSYLWDALVELRDVNDEEEEKKKGMGISPKKTFQDLPYIDHGDSISVMTPDGYVQLPKTLLKEQKQRQEELLQLQAKGEGDQQERDPTPTLVVQYDENVPKVKSSEETELEEMRRQIEEEKEKMAQERQKLQEESEKLHKEADRLKEMREKLESPEQRSAREILELETEQARQAIERELAERKERKRQRQKEKERKEKAEAERKKLLEVSGQDPELPAPSGTTSRAEGDGEDDDDDDIQIVKIEPGKSALKARLTCALCKDSAGGTCQKHKSDILQELRNVHVKVEKKDEDDEDVYEPRWPLARALDEADKCDACLNEREKGSETALCDHHYRKIKELTTEEEKLLSIKAEKKDEDDGGSGTSGLPPAKKARTEDPPRQEGDPAQPSSSSASPGKTVKSIIRPRGDGEGYVVFEYSSSDDDSIDDRVPLCTAFKRWGHPDSYKFPQLDSSSSSDAEDVESFGSGVGLLDDNNDQEGDEVHVDVGSNFDENNIDDPRLGDEDAHKTSQDNEKSSEAKDCDRFPLPTINMNERPPTSRQIALLNRKAASVFRKAVANVDRPSTSFALSQSYVGLQGKRGRGFAGSASV